MLTRNLILLSGGLQPEVQAYKTLTAGAVAPAVINALNTFVKTGKQQGWWGSLLEVYPFCGSTLASSLVKLKYIPGNASSLVNNNFVSGDYTQAAGFGQTANVAKWLQTGFTFPAGGISSTDYMTMVSLVDAPVNNAYYFMGDSAATVDSTFGVRGTDIVPNPSTSIESAPSGLVARSFSQTGAGSFLTHNGQTGQVIGATAAFTSTTEVLLFKRSLEGNPLYAAGKMLMSGIGHALTQAQSASMCRAVATLQLAIRSGLRGSPQFAWAFLGDSIMAHYAATTTSAMWTNKVVVGRTRTEFNFGMAGRKTSGITLSAQSSLAGLLETYSSIFSFNFGKVFVMIGTNDQLVDVTTNGNSTLISAYQVSLTSILNGLAAQYGAANIVVVSPPWNTGNNSTKNGAWNTAMSVAATAAGVTFVDFYSYFVSQGSPAGWMTDTVHPNNTGMTEIANQVLAVV